MFRRMIWLLILGLMSSLSLDLQASGRGKGGKGLTKKQGAPSRILRSSRLPVRVVVHGRVSREARELARSAGIPLEQAVIFDEAADAWLQELSRNGRFSHLSPQQRGALTKMRKGWRRSNGIKKAEAPVAEALLQFRTEDVCAALQEAETAGQLVAKLAEIISFADRVTTGRRGFLADRIRETADQLRTLHAQLTQIPGDAEVGIYDGDGGDDIHGGDVEAVSLKQRLSMFVRSNQRSGYKLLTVCTVLAGTAYFAPVYLPVALAGSAVGGAVSATLRAVGSTMSGTPVTAGAVAESVIDGMLSGSVSSVMPGGSFVNAGVTGATISALRAACEGKDLKNIGKDALVGGAVGVAAYGATSWAFPQTGAVVDSDDGVMGPVAVPVEPQPQLFLPAPTMPKADHRSFMQSSGLPPFTVPAKEDLSRAMVSVVPQQPMCTYSTAVVPVPADMGVCLAMPMCEMIPTRSVAADLQARLVAIEQMIAAQDGAIQDAAKPLARKFYDGIGLTNLFDRVLARTAESTARTPQCALDAATFAELQQCVGELEATVVEQGAVLQEALKPMARKVYDGVGLTGLFDRVFGRFVYRGGTQGFACASSAVTVDDLAGCVEHLERTVVARDASILEALTPLARKFYNAIGLTSLVAAVRG